MSRLFRELLFGDADIKEYATITVDQQINEKVYLEAGNTLTDISANHWLLCLEPLIFGIWITKQHPVPAGAKQGYQMHFTGPPGNDQQTAKGEALAGLSLDFFDQLNEKDGSLLLLRCRKSSVYHINMIRTRLLYLKYYKKPKVSFPGLKSLAAAYSYPRKVRLVSFRQGDYYNIFPMDLLGGINGGNRYVFGLRHTNTALSRIIGTKKIVVSEVSFEHKETIYRLGSHHSAAPPSADQLPFKVISTKNFGFYIPEWVDSYKEIRIDQTIDLGSHMLLWGEVLDECQLKASAGNLYHIHYLLYLHHKRAGGGYPLV